MTEHSIIAPDESHMEPARMDLAGIVADRVDIEDIRLVETSASYTQWEAPDGEAPPLTVDVNIAVKTETVAEKGIRVFPRFTVSVRATDAEAKEPVIYIVCRYQLFYALKDWSGLTKEHFHSFGQLNGVYNCWPYLREYVQSITVRMGFPPLTLAVYRLPVSRESAQVESP